MTTWKDISSAPKDGTPILLAYSDGGVVEGSFVDNSDKHPAWCGFMPRPLYPQKAGVRITHWMPLPPPPHKEP